MSKAKLNPPALIAKWLPEPNLAFGGGEIHSDPKIGISLFGPRSFGSARHRSEIHFGFIGTGESIAKATDFYRSCAQGVDGDGDHEPFPGCAVDLGFRATLKLDGAASELITATDLGDLKKIKGRKERFERAIELLDEKLRLLVQQDRPIDYIVFAVPDELWGMCRVAEYIEKGLGRVSRNLRRAFKVLAMKYEKPTQLILSKTANPVIAGKNVDHKSVRAWNLFTGMYFKVDGIPWTPEGLDAETCFVGVSFYRPLGLKAFLRTSLAQAFDDQGEGFVLRGREFEWDEQRQGKAPHLPFQAARELIQNVIARYKDERKTLPKRIVVHKSSEYWKDELEGFQEGLREVARHDLLALRFDSRVRLVREGAYPPLRGTAVDVGSHTYLYTTGYIKSLERYPHGHVPTPVEVFDHHGDTAKAKLYHEILQLTKMNWNSANFAGGAPITLKFARTVGEILKEMPEGFAASPKYKYYM